MGWESWRFDCQDNTTTSKHTVLSPSQHNNSEQQQQQRPANTAATAAATADRLFLQNNRLDTAVTLSLTSPRTVSTHPIVHTYTRHSHTCSKNSQENNDHPQPPTPHPPRALPPIQHLRAIHTHPGTPAHTSIHNVRRYIHTYTHTYTIHIYIHTFCLDCVRALMSVGACLSSSALMKVYAVPFRPALPVLPTRCT